MFTVRNRIEERRRWSGLAEETDDGLDLTGCEDFLADEPALAAEGVAQHTAGLQLAIEALASPGVGTEGIVEGGQLGRSVGAKTKGVFHGAFRIKSEK